MHNTHTHQTSAEASNSEMKSSIYQHTHTSDTGDKFLMQTSEIKHLRWWSGIVVTRWSQSTKLTYIGPS